MRHIWGAAPATQNDDRDLQNAAPATKTATHLVRRTQKYCACHHTTLSNRLECHKVPGLPRKTTWQPAWKPSKRRGLAAFPIDTARPQENQRLETRHMGASKRAFRARLPPILTLCSFKIDVFPGVFFRTSNLLPQNRCFVRGFRQSSSHLTKRHACHGICTLSPLDAPLTMRFAQNTQHDTSKVLRLPRKMTLDTSKVLRLPRKTATYLAKTSQKYCACHTKRLSTRYKTRLNVTKCHACHAKRSNATFETSKNDPFCRTYHRHGNTGIARTVANGCERLGNVERTHPQPPDPQSETGTLATHSGKRKKLRYFWTREIHSKFRRGGSNWKLKLCN